MKTLSESNQRERDWREKQKFSLSNIIEEKMYKKYWENTFALQWEKYYKDYYYIFIRGRPNRM